MSYKIVSRFIKDISFEIPDAQTFVMLEKEILNYNLKFDINSKPFKENIIEVNTILRLSPNQNVNTYDFQVLFIYNIKASVETVDLINTLFFFRWLFSHKICYYMI